MPKTRRTPGGGEVEKPASVVSSEIGTIATSHRQRKESKVGHLRDGPAFASVEVRHATSRPLLEEGKDLVELNDMAIDHVDDFELALVQLVGRSSSTIVNDHHTEALVG